MAPSSGCAQICARGRCFAIRKHAYLVPKSTKIPSLKSSEGERKQTHNHTHPTVISQTASFETCYNRGKNNFALQGCWSVIVLALIKV